MLEPIWKYGGHLEFCQKVLPQLFKELEGSNSEFKLISINLLLEPSLELETSSKSDKDEEDRIKF